MTPAQWAWMARAHADRERENREFTSQVVQACIEYFSAFTKAVLGSEQFVPEGSPKGAVVSLIAALADGERLRAIKEVKVGGNLTPDAERAFMDKLRQKMLASNAETDLILPEQAPASSNTDTGSFDFTLFEPYLDKDDANDAVEVAKVASDTQD